MLAVLILLLFLGSRTLCVGYQYNAVLKQTMFSDDRLVRETRSKNTFSVLLLFEPALPLGIEHSLGQPGTSLFYNAALDY